MVMSLGWMDGVCSCPHCTVVTFNRKIGWEHKHIYIQTFIQSRIKNIFFIILYFCICIVYNIFIVYSIVVVLYFYQLRVSTVGLLLIVEQRVSSTQCLTTKTDHASQ